MNEKTLELLSLLPYWVKARQTEEETNFSVFFDVFGSELSDAEAVIEYFYQQLSIDTADESFISTIYKAVIPLPVNSYASSYAKADGVILHKCNTIEELFASLNDNIFSSLNYKDPYFFHPTKNEIYFGKYHEIVELTVGETVLELVPEAYQVWNPFDEIGALFNLQRINGESNESLKARIKDVFIHRAGNTREGLINGVGRELALREKYRWFKTDKEVELYEKNILINSISIIYPDGSITKPKVYIKDNGNLYLKPLITSLDGVFISYIKDFSIHNMNDAEDQFIKKYYKNSTGVANRRMRKAAKQMREFSYDSFIWDQAFSQDKPTHVLPHRYDASKEGFKIFNNMTIDQINKMYEEGVLS